MVAFTHRIHFIDFTSFVFHDMIHFKVPCLQYIQEVIMILNVLHSVSEFLNAWNA